MEYAQIKNHLEPLFTLSASSEKFNRNRYNLKATYLKINYKQLLKPLCTFKFSNFLIKLMQNYCLLYYYLYCLYCY